MEEIREVVFAMNRESAAGPDGFIGTFFSFAWEVVGNCENLKFSYFLGFILFNCMPFRYFLY